ncbi:HTH domain-containing protein [Curtobacterium citreum]|uniref:HTH domain-containing protein n=1 Tax=Curtobacterium citreum TaxID=2036 RepID=UPI0025439040|nr:HTH domain-containing protein [Curtobacterium citreum]WIJ44834.1 hypothetical protein QPK07_14040 [Curtobacterium citreum]
MSTEAYDVDQGLRHLIDTGRISPESISAMTGIAPEHMREYLASEHRTGTALSGLSGAQTTQLSMLSVLLTEGLAEDDDIRLRALVETLTQQYHLTHENVALLIDTDVADVEAVVLDARRVDASKKYRLALRLSYVLTALSNVERVTS